MLGDELLGVYDAPLGKFYVDNEFVPELDILGERMFKWIDYTK